MSTSVCFRCDWSGETSARACPRCGTPLYREERRAPPASRNDDGQGRTGVEGSRTRSPQAVLGAIVIAVVLVGFAGVGLRQLWGSPAPADGTANGPAAEPASSLGSVGPTGRLLYVTSDGLGSRLVVLDLVGGAFELGPKLPDPVIDLVDASGAEPGWVGVESLSLSDSHVASVLEDLAPDARVQRLGRGRSVAWGPRGVTVAIGIGDRFPSACPGVEVAIVALRTGSHSPGIDEGAVCGPALGLGRSAAATYLSATGDAGFGLYLMGAVGVPHLLFPQAQLLSSSPVSAFLFVRRERATTDTDGELMLRWRGTGGPVVFEDDGEPFQVFRVLTWSRDGLEAAVLGRLGDTRGVFVVDATPGEGPRAPTRVVDADNGDATFAADGTLYVVDRARLLRFQDGALAEVPLPPGAPTPLGQILWQP